ncbi:MAG: hypothetical protein GC204_07630 [Chloroflexi bacterium]|nr:hypothetical protein [Chloroflexota bacterium]
MSYNDLFVVLFTFALLITVVRVLWPKHDTGDLLYDETGNLGAIGAHAQSEGKLSGLGSFTSAPLELAEGSYRIDYEFNTLTRLVLLDAKGDEKNLFIKRNVGTKPLEIPETGRYCFLVKPVDEEAWWRIVYHQLS